MHLRVSKSAQHIRTLICEPAEGVCASFILTAPDSDIYGPRIMLLRLFTYMIPWRASFLLIAPVSDIYVLCIMLLRLFAYRY